MPPGRKTAPPGTGRTLGHSPDVSGRRRRIVALGESLPEAVVEAAGRHCEHLVFKAFKKVFAYYTYDHHADGMIALLCKAPPGEQALLIGQDPAAYFVPPYVGAKGWVGFRLDGSRLDWKVVENLLRLAHYLSQPEKRPRPPARAVRPSKTPPRSRRRP